MARPNVGAVLDNFNRADGAIGANWSNEPFNDSPTPFAILTNQMVETNHSDMWWNVSSFANVAGIACGATIGANLAPKQTAGGFNGYYIGLIQQPSASSNTCDGYQVGLRRRSGGTGKDTITIWRYDNAAVGATLLAETDLATDLAVNDTFDIEVGIGATNNIKVYRNGTVIATVTDTTYFHAGQSAFGELSIVGAGSDPRSNFDDFYCGQISGGTLFNQALTTTAEATAATVPKQSQKSLVP